VWYRNWVPLWRIGGPSGPPTEEEEEEAALSLNVKFSPIKQKMRVSVLAAFGVAPISAGTIV
jgi:hypothetical protein